MDILSHLSLGLQEAATWTNLFYCFLGVVLGMLVGVLPGLGPVPTIAMLLPITFGLPPTTGLIMLAGIFYGSQYGGSVTAILLNIPGEISSVVTTIDGNKLARQGKAGAALTVSAVGSFFGGCVATFFIAAFAVPLAALALRFGPQDYVALMLLGLIGSVAMTSGSVLNAFGMMCLGCLLGLVGTDVTSGTLRYTLGLDVLSDGIDFVTLAMALFGLSSVIATLIEAGSGQQSSATKVGPLRLTREEVELSVPPILRGTAIGTILGLLPGGGVVLASFLSYFVERKISRHPERFGEGALEGVAGPETANNAASQTTFVPLLVLGLPTNAVAAMMSGAMMIHSITSGPDVISSNPSLFWGLIVSMWIGNIMLLLLNLPLVGFWVRIAAIPYRFIFPAIVLFSCVGVYSVSQQPDSILLLVLFAGLGYIFYLLKCEPAPLLMGAVLAPLIEEHFKRTMLMSRGSFAIFIESPASLFLILLTLIILVLATMPKIARWREAHLHD